MGVFAEHRGLGGLEVRVFQHEVGEQEVEELVEPGQLDPNQVHTPGIYVDRLICGTFEKRIEKRTLRS